MPRSNPCCPRHPPQVHANRGGEGHFGDLLGDCHCCAHPDHCRPTRGSHATDDSRRQHDLRLRLRAPQHVPIEPGYKEILEDNVQSIMKDLREQTTDVSLRVTLAETWTSTCWVAHGKRWACNSCLFQAWDAQHGWCQRQHVSHCVGVGGERESHSVQVPVRDDSVQAAGGIY